MNPEYVWYACYGSNLNRDRFMIYIRGGSLEVDGHRVTEKGSADRSEPTASEVCRLPFKLLFLGHFEKWENKSAAFLDLSHREHNLKTVCRLYRITKEQFMDVVRQENGGVPPKAVDFDALRKNGETDLYPDHPYGRLVYVEEKDGIPVVTFTCTDAWLSENGSVGDPSGPYLEVIRDGLTECGLDAADAEMYLQARLPQKTDCAVVPTGMRHRKHAVNDYVIGMNSKTRQENQIGAFAVARYIVENAKCGSDLEWKTLSAYGKVVIDEDLPDHVVALDQTLRNAIGLPYRETTGQCVRVAPLHLSFMQNLTERIHPGQRLFMRVNMASPLDMEKNSCRVSEDALTVMRAREGEHIWLGRCVPEGVQLAEGLHLTEGKQMPEEVNTPEGGLPTDGADSTDGRKMPDGGQLTDGKHLSEGKLLPKGTDSPDGAKKGEGLRMQVAEPDKVSRDRQEIAEWMSCSAYRLREIRIRAYCANDKTEEAILKARENSAEDETSFYGLYPDAETILKLENDLETIRLDKYCRDLLDSAPLDTLKVRRRLADRVASESIDFGLVFVLTVFAAIMALNQDNVGILPLSLIISAAAAIILTLIKTK